MHLPGISWRGILKNGNAVPRTCRIARYLQKGGMQGPGSGWLQFFYQGFDQADYCCKGVSSLGGLFLKPVIETSSIEKTRPWQELLFRVRTCCVPGIKFGRNIGYNTTSTWPRMRQRHAEVVYTLLKCRVELGSLAIGYALRARGLWAYSAAGGRIARS